MRAWNEGSDRRNRAIELDPILPKALVPRRRARSYGSAESAVALYHRDAHRADPHSANGAPGSMGSALCTRRYDEAEDRVKSGWRCGPSSDMTRSLLSDLRLRQDGDAYVEARKLWEEPSRSIQAFSVPTLRPIRHLERDPSCSMASSMAASGNILYP